MLAVKYDAVEYFRFVKDIYDKMPGSGFEGVIYAEYSSRANMLIVLTIIFWAE